MTDLEHHRKMSCLVTLQKSLRKQNGLKLLSNINTPLTHHVLENYPTSIPNRHENAVLSMHVLGLLSTSPKRSGKCRMGTFLTLKYIYLLNLIFFFYAALRISQSYSVSGVNVPVGFQSFILKDFFVNIFKDRKNVLH